MKKILPILLALALPAQAAGPIYQHQNPIVEQEFENVYQDIQHINNSDINTSTATIRWLNLSSGTVNGVNLSASATVPSSNVTGTITNDSAAAGRLGEYVELTYSGVNGPASGAWGDAGSISLTAGDWNVTHMMEADNSGATSVEVIGISVTSGNDGTGLVNGVNRCKVGAPTLPTTTALTVAAYRMSLSATTTVYAKRFHTFTGTDTATGRMSARRVR